MTDPPSNWQGPFSALRRFARPTPPAERCALCGATLAAVHEHLAEPAARRLLCCCAACALLFSAGEPGRYWRVSSRLELLPDFRMSQACWLGLAAPVGLAFFYPSTPAGCVRAVFPSPAGLLESPVAAGEWDALAHENAVLHELEPDVEALLVNRVDGPHAYYRASLDRCYELAGIVRTHWRGFSGGPVLREEVRRFFARVGAPFCPGGA